MHYSITILIFEQYLILDPTSRGKVDEIAPFMLCCAADYHYQGEFSPRLLLIRKQENEKLNFNI